VGESAPERTPDFAALPDCSPALKPPVAGPSTTFASADVRISRTSFGNDGVSGGSIIDSSPGNLNGESSSSFRLQSSLENVQEFRVESSNYPLRYGTGTGDRSRW